MAPLQLRLFGPLQAHRSDTGSEVAFAGRPAELLAYLALHRSRRHSRARLAGILWGDLNDQNARRCLSTTLWRLRSQLDALLPKGTSVFHAGRHELAFHPGTAIEIDVATFEAATLPVAAGNPPPNAEVAAAVEHGLGLYRSELLDGMFHDWILRERRRLRGLRLSALIALMRFHREREEPGQALRWGEELLREEPYNEAVIRELMSLHVRNGRRGLALELYASAVRVLAEDLDAEPMEETRALYERIRRAGAGGVPGAAEPGPAFTGLARRLRTAAQDLDEARSHVRRAMEQVESTPDSTAGRGEDG